MLLLRPAAPADCAELTELVLRSKRSRGYGDLLTRRALTWLHGREARRVVLEVAVGKEATHPFYARHGFLPRTVLLEEIDQDTPNIAANI